MTPTQQTSLQTLIGRTLTSSEITTLDPLVLARNDVQIAAALSTGRTKVGSVPRDVFAIWCGSTGLRSAIEDNAANTASPLRAISLTLKDFLQSAALNGIDMNNPSNSQMLATWVSAGALTQAQSDTLLSMAIVPNPVAVNDVSNTLNAAS